MTIASPPLVGVSACVKDLNGFPFHAVNQRYLVALSEICGVLPMLIPALGSRIDPTDLAARLDGLVLTGSPSNVEPHHYESEPAAPDIARDPARDGTTLPLIREAIRQGVPVLAICRGHQELNVALGGSLHQFVHQVPGRFDHRSDKTLPIGERWRRSHTVTFTPGGLLGQLAGSETILVNSLHNQGIDRLAPGLAIEAVADDGTVEAVRVRDARTFAIGVQWHPEALCHDCDFARGLFESFGRAVQARAAERVRVPIAAE